MNAVENQKACPRVKVCGLTRPEEARAVAEAGADAIGLVFFPKSPRHLEPDTAAIVSRAIPESLVAVGVFVDAAYSTIMGRVEDCNLGAVQLHGNEPPELVGRLQANGLVVIKALFDRREPFLARAEDYPACPFLIESGVGALPGGNAETWDWGAIADFATRYPTVLAGGLDPQNVAAAVSAVRPAAVDVSSGVELRPGRKAIDKVTAFLAALRTACDSSRPPSPANVFRLV